MDVGTAESTEKRGWLPRLPFFYGWLIVAGLAVSGCVNSSFYWLPPLFVLPMQEELGWSRTSVFAAMTIRGLVGAFVSPFFGAMLDRRGGAIKLAAASGIIGGLSLIPIAWVQAEWQFLLLFGLIGGLAQVGQAIAVLGAVLPRWFVHNRSSAMATATIGPPLGSFSTPLVAGALIAAFGWRTAWMLMGVILLIVGTLPAFVFHRRPEDVGLLPDGGKAPAPSRRAPASVDPERSTTGREALRTRAFWLLTIATSSASLATSALPASLIPMFVDRGVALELALLGISFHGASSLLTRFLWAWLTHRFHIRAVLLGIALYGTVITPLPFLLQGDFLVLYAGIIAVGTGGFVSTNALIWPAYFGRAHLGAITGYVRPLQTGLAAIAPLIIPFLYERLGNYNLATWVVVGAWITFGVCLWLVPRRLTASA